MSPSNVKETRHRLLLSVSGLAQMLDTDASTIRKMELTEGSSQHRKPAPRMIRLMDAYMRGYRPHDWPK